MADKRVRLAVGSLRLNLLRATSAEVEEQLDSDVVKTFDEPVTTPSSEGGYNINISALEARSLEEFKRLKKIIKQLKTKKGTLSLFETVRHKKGDFEVEYHFSDVTLTSNKVSYDAEDLTARDLSFNAAVMRELVDNEEI